MRIRSTLPPLRSTTVTAGAVTLLPSLYTDADTFYSAEVTNGVALIFPPLYTDGDTFYSATATVGAVTLSAALYSDADTFYAASIAQVTSLTATLYSDADTFYSATVTVGAATLTATLFEDGDTFYAATVTGGAAVEEERRGSVKDKTRRKRRSQPVAPRPTPEELKQRQAEIVATDDGSSIVVPVLSAELTREIAKVAASDAVALQAAIDAERLYNMRLRILLLAA
jgi:hypothetical protein